MSLGPVIPPLEVFQGPAWEVMSFGGASSVPPSEVVHGYDWLVMSVWGTASIMHLGVLSC